MPLSINTINMIFEVRQLYEPYILLNYGNALSVERLKDFYNIFSSSKTNHNCYNNNDYFYELDTEFHNFVVDACPNTYIHQNYNMIQTQAERFRYMTGNISEKRLDDTFQEHLDIIRACLRNDKRTKRQHQLCRKGTDSHHQRQTNHAQLCTTGRAIKSHARITISQSRSDAGSASTLTCSWNGHQPDYQRLCRKEPAFRTNTKHLEPKQIRRRERQRQPAVPKRKIRSGCHVFIYRWNIIR